MSQPPPSSSDMLDNLDMLIVGAGFAGLAMLHQARKLGLNALVIDAAQGVGGTWYHNRYPGARVDIQSLEYSFSFDEDLQQQWQWTERYAAQPELLRYANHVADRFALRDGITLGTRLAGARFDEADNTWLARSDDGRQWRARFLVMASGGLSAPNTPAFDGLDRFEGRVLHTANWPHESIDFKGQRVAVVGTGSSAVQLIPVLAEQGAQLTVFQRTATYAVPARNAPLDPGFEARIKADYAGFRARNRRMRLGFGSEQPGNAASALAATPAERESAFEARWQVGGFGFLGAYGDLMLNDQANATAAEFVRQKIRATVLDPATAERLCPSHPIGCKRLCVDSGYYASFNRPNVRLVDVSQAPIERITPSGLRQGGQDQAFDTLVLATGFDAMTGTLLRLDLRGRGGQTLQDKWQAGPLNLLGLMVAGFPNLFTIAGAGSPAAFTSVITSIEHHVQWIASAVQHLQRSGQTLIEATPEAEAAWVGHVNAMAEPTLFMRCNSWYLGANIPGKTRLFMPLLGGFPAYTDHCDAVARRGYEGFALG